MSEFLTNRAKVFLPVLVGIILGFILVQQYSLALRRQKAVSSESFEDLSFQIANLSKSNEELKKEIGELETQKVNLEKSILDRRLAFETLEKDITKFEIITGKTKVSGEGVEVSFEEQLPLPQLIDLLNAIHNIGGESIAVNGRRIVYNSQFSQNSFQKPIVVSTIGNSQLLHDALVRPGGILQQIGSGKVEIKESLTLPALGE